MTEFRLNEYISNVLVCFFHKISPKIKQSNQGTWQMSRFRHPAKQKQLMLSPLLTFVEWSSVKFVWTWDYPLSSQTGWVSKMSLTAWLLDISVPLWTQQLATASLCFSCHMRHTDQTAGWCEGHSGVSEADVSLDTMPPERSQCVVKRVSTVRGEQGSTAQRRAAGGAEGNLNATRQQTLGFSFLSVC